MAIFRDCGSVGTYTPTTGGTAKFFGCAVASSNSATISGTIDPSLLNTDLILVCDGNAGDNCSFGFSASNVVLPIELEMFSVFCEEDNIDLRWSTYSEINNAKFKNKVVPGDTLIFELGLLSPFRRGICHMWGTAYVGNKVVMEAEMTAQIVKKPNT